MDNNIPYKININVEPFYIEDQSAPEENRYVFAYTVRKDVWWMSRCRSVAPTFHPSSKAT